MKKLNLLFSAFLLIFISTNVSAGGVKDLLIDTEEAITSEFADYGIRVDSISNYSFTPIKSGIGVKADVETTNLESKIEASWTCIVSFQQNGSSYSPSDVDCK